MACLIFFYTLMLLSVGERGDCLSDSDIDGDYELIKPVMPGGRGHSHRDALLHLTRNTQVRYSLVLSHLYR